MNGNQDTKGFVLNTPPALIVKTEEKPLLIKTAHGIEAQTPNKKAERGKAFRQVIAALIANIGTINVGFAFGFSAVAVPQLRSGNSFIHVNENEGSWIASLSSAGTPIGCILGGYLMDAFGRRKTLIITEIPLIIGWLMIAFATNVPLIYAGRIFVGIGAGILGAPARVYTSEVTQPHLRGMLTALASTGISLGVLLQYGFGAFLSWHILAGLSTTIPLLAMILMYFMPETPNYLVSKSRVDKAYKSLAKLRGSTYNLEKEVNQLQEFTVKNNAKKVTSPKELFIALIHPSALKPFGILFFYFMIYQFGGVNTITFYAVEIFKDAVPHLDPNMCTLILGIVRLIFTIAGGIALRRFGRRPMTFISSWGCGLSMLTLGIYLYFKYTWETSEPRIEPTQTWIPVACLIIFTMAVSLGFLVVPWVMIGELYPQKVRGIIGGLTTCCAHSFVFIVVKTYPLLVHALYQHGAFMLYGCISIAGSLFFYFVLPETKGKTLQEIEDYFSGRTKSLNTKKSKVPQSFDTITNNNLNYKPVPPNYIENNDKLIMSETS